MTGCRAGPQGGKRPKAAEGRARLGPPVRSAPPSLAGLPRTTRTDLPGLRHGSDDGGRGQAGEDSSGGRQQRAAAEYGTADGGGGRAPTRQAVVSGRGGISNCQGTTRSRHPRGNRTRNMWSTFLRTRTCRCGTRHPPSTQRERSTGKKPGVSPLPCLPTSPPVLFHFAPTCLQAESQYHHNSPHARAQYKIRGGGGIPQPGAVGCGAVRGGVGRGHSQQERKQENPPQMIVLSTHRTPTARLQRPRRC